MSHAKDCQAGLHSAANNSWSSDMAHQNLLVSDDSHLCLDIMSGEFLLTYIILWKVWTQESFQKLVEFDRPGEHSPE